VDQALDRDLSVVVVQGGQDPRERRDRVDRGSAVCAAVDRQVQRADRDDAIDDAADAGLERRDARPPVPPVGHADHVRQQELPVPLDEERQVLGAGLLLALDQDLDGHRRPASPGAQGRRVDHDAALVVGRAPPVHPALANLGLERRAGPLVERPLGLHVVMGVQQHRGGAFRTGDLTEHGRVIHVRELDQADAAEARSLQDVRGRLGRCTHRLVVVSGERDRRDADERLQLLDDPRSVAGDRVSNVVGVHEAGTIPDGRPVAAYGQRRSSRHVRPSRV
jgi:hypothetical protein